MGLKRVFRHLHDQHGPQRWWPADSRFEVMVGAVLTQNTAWVNVERAIANLRQADALSPRAIVAAPPRRLAAWLRPSGYYNVKAKRLRALCAMVLDNGGVAALARGSTSALRRSLLAVHGVGPETADDILLYAFGRPVFVIDAYTRRLFKRFGLVRGDEPYEVLRAWFERSLGEDIALYREYHALIVMHGKEVCRSTPVCEACSLTRACRFHRGQGR